MEVSYQRLVKSGKGFSLTLEDLSAGSQGMFHAQFSFLTPHTLSLSNAGSITAVTCTQHYLYLLYTRWL